MSLPYFHDLCAGWKRFPDTRQNKRKEFTGLGDWLLAQRANLMTDHGEPPVRTVGQFKGESTPSRVSRRPGFDPWVGKIPWRREWYPLQ